MKLPREPRQPAESTWKFVKELQTPLHRKINWERTEPAAGEANLAGGVTVEAEFPDPDNLLATAYKDFGEFLKSGDISASGPYRIITAQGRTRLFETYRVKVGATSCRIIANDTEGIRRGLVYVEDEILRARGPFIRLQNTERKPYVKTRISRCFYSPIHRPPKMRDELTDDVNYYPDDYLQRLVHHGINALWLTIRYAETCPSKYLPEHGRYAARRQEKLRRTVEQCRRFGIRIFAFGVIPLGFPKGSPIPAKYPELRGHVTDEGFTYFCTSSKRGQNYLEDATKNLFKNVPGLGGIITICVGENRSHCGNNGLPPKFPPINCPRCSKRDLQDVLNDTLSAMKRGMQAVDPNAELIAWPYGQSSMWGLERSVESAGRMTKGVCQLYDFEKRGKSKQLGKFREAHDYFLSYIGPAKFFRDSVAATQRAGNRPFAKLQVGNSHEVATVPFVPVPSNLYRKYKTIHKLGITGVMQCWFFGNYPSLMTKAAGELSFEPFSRTEDQFLRFLASKDWGRHAPKVVRAWKLFSEGYCNYPLTSLFSYFGPMHDGPVWPLYLEPRGLPLGCTWNIRYPTSGDFLGFCMLSSHTLDEVLTLCKRMVRSYSRGMNILKQIEPDLADNPERLADIRVCEALGLQFQSGLNILTIYALREKLADMKGKGRLKVLERMRRLVEAELEIDRQLLELAEADSRLGFHSEAEGYKYFPAKIRWRMNWLGSLLKTEFPRIERRVRKGLAAFPKYTGETPEGALYTCRRLRGKPAMNGRPFGGVWDKLVEAECAEHWQGALYEWPTQRAPAREQRMRRTTWKAGYDDEALYVGFHCVEPDMAALRTGLKDKRMEMKSFARNDCVEVRINAERLFPGRQFIANADGKRQHNLHLLRNSPSDDYRWKVSTAKSDDGWSAIVRIPFACFAKGRFDKKPLRVNVGRIIPAPAQGQMVTIHRWIEPFRDPRTSLQVNALLPQDTGWFVFK